MACALRRAGLVFDTKVTCFTCFRFHDYSLWVKKTSRFHLKPNGVNARPVARIVI